MLEAKRPPQVIGFSVDIKGPPHDPRRQVRGFLWVLCTTHHTWSRLWDPPCQLGPVLYLSFLAADLTIPTGR